MRSSFREKSLWLMLASLVGVFGFYFATALPSPNQDVMPEQMVQFVLAIVMLVVIQVVGHAVIAIVDRRADVDERDKLIELRGTNYSSYVMGTGAFFSLCAALVTNGNFVFTHILLAFWVLAEITRIASQLFMHRKGV